MNSESETILTVYNIRDLPWYKDEDLERLGTIPAALRLPKLSDVIQVAQEVFENSQRLRGDWENSEEFLRRDDVRNYLRSIVLAFQKLKESASHTDVYCEWKDDFGNLCGSKMEIAVDPNGAYYRCISVPKKHRTPKGS